MVEQYDIAFIGGGRLNIRTFVELAERLKDAPPAATKQKIIWLHDREGFGGPAYDPALSPPPLPFHQNIMDIEPEGEFPEWLKANRAKVIEFLENANTASKKWLENTDDSSEISYRQYLENGDYGTGSLKELRIPRAIYGLYLKEKMDAAIAATKDIFDVIVLQAEAEVFKANEDGTFDLKIVGVDDHFSAKKVCLGAGMRPNLQHPQLADNLNYFDNLYYEGSTVIDIERAISWQFEKTGKPVSLLIEGAGPAAMDLVNWVASSPGLQDKVVLDIVSGHSRLRPPAEEPKREGEIYSLSLINTKHQTTEAFFNAIRGDIATALADGFSRPEAVAAILPHIQTAAQKLPDEERSIFEEQYARFYIQNLVFDGVETVNAWNHLVQKGILRFHEGFYVIPETAKSGVSGMIIAAQSGNSTQILECDFLVNCTGGRIKIDEQTPQLNALVQSGIASRNPAGTGLNVDEYFQAKPGLYVGGYTIKGSPPATSGIPKGLEALGPAIDKTAKTIAGHLNLELKLAPLRALPVEDRGRMTLDHLLQNSGLTPKDLEDAGFPFSAPAEDSYGRKLIPAPEQMELLVVSLLPGYAPAIHTHGPGTAGANLLCVEGSFYNVDYVEKDEVMPDGSTQRIIRHGGIQRFNKGDVAYVSDNHLHRVVNLSDEPAESVNAYWDNGGMREYNEKQGIKKSNVGEEAFVLDAVDGTCVTTTGPAFFFREADGKDKQTGLKFSELVQLEDIVFQHHQLSTELKTNGDFSEDRRQRLDRLNTIIKGKEFRSLLNTARLEAESLIKKPGKTGTEDVTAEYFTALFTKVEKMLKRPIAMPEIPRKGRG